MKFTRLFPNRLLSMTVRPLIKHYAVIKPTKMIVGRQNVQSNDIALMAHAIVCLVHNNCKCF